MLDFKLSFRVENALVELLESLTARVRSSGNEYEGRAIRAIRGMYEIPDQITDDELLTFIEFEVQKRNLARQAKAQKTAAYRREQNIPAAVPDEIVEVLMNHAERQREARGPFGRSHDTPFEHGPMSGFGRDGYEAEEDPEEDDEIPDEDDTEVETEYIPVHVNGIDLNLTTEQSDEVDYLAFNYGAYAEEVSVPRDIVSLLSQYGHPLEEGEWFMKREDNGPLEFFKHAESVAVTEPVIEHADDV